MAKLSTGKQKKREEVLDFLRGVVVITMIFTHVIMFFHDLSDPTLFFFADLGGIVSFTGFLLVSGASSYYYFTSKKRKQSEIWKKTISRSLNLLLGYYAVALIAILPDVLERGLPAILEVILLINVPMYTEFILPFIFFSLLMPLLYPALKNSLQKPRELMLLVSAAYIMGIFIWYVDLSYLGVGVKSLVSHFAGYDNWHRFPILEYLPIFVGGFYLGNFLKETTGKAWHKRRQRLRMALSVVVACLLGFGGITLIKVLKFGSATLDTGFITLSMQRFPPSIPFLLISSAFAFGVLAVFFILEPFLRGRAGVISRGIQFLGLKTFPIFIFHIIFLYVISHFFGAQTLKIWQVWVLIPVVLWLSAMYAFFVGRTGKIKDWVQSLKR